MATDNGADDVDDLNEEQQDRLDDFVRKAKAVIAWVDQMPPLDEIGSSVVLAALAARKELEGSGMTEEEIKNICGWLSKRYTDVMLISGVVRGHLGIKWREEENQPVFCLTPRGRNAADQLDPERN